MVLFTFGLLFTSYLQWDAIKESVQISERAHVVTFIQRGAPLTGDVPISMQNVGDTPAPFVRMRFREIRSMRNGPCIEGGYGRLDSRGPLFPGEVGLTTWHHPLRWFRATESALIASETEHVVISGSIEYGTGFGETDGYGFCWAYVPQTASWATCVYEPENYPTE